MAGTSNLCRYAFCANKVLLGINLKVLKIGDAEFVNTMDECMYVGYEDAKDEMGKWKRLKEKDKLMVPGTLILVNECVWWHNDRVWIGRQIP